MDTFHDIIGSDAETIVWWQMVCRGTLIFFYTLLLVRLLFQRASLGDTIIARVTRGRALLRVFNELGYDALALGNQEPDFGSGTLKEWVAAAEFPVLASNVV